MEEDNSIILFKNSEIDSKMSNTISKLLDYKYNNISHISKGKIFVTRSYKSRILVDCIVIHHKGGGSRYLYEDEQVYKYLNRKHKLKNLINI
jgi:hypothetical protein